MPYKGSFHQETGSCLKMLRMLCTAEHSLPRPDHPPDSGSEGPGEPFPQFCEFKHQWISLSMEGFKNGTLKGNEGQPGLFGWPWGKGPISISLPVVPSWSFFPLCFDILTISSYISVSRFDGIHNNRDKHCRRLTQKIRPCILFDCLEAHDPQCIFQLLSFPCFLQCHRMVCL